MELFRCLRCSFVMSLPWSPFQLFEHLSYLCLYVGMWHSTISNMHSSDRDGEGTLSGLCQKQARMITAGGKNQANKTETDILMWTSALFCFNFMEKKVACMCKLWKSLLSLVILYKWNGTDLPLLFGVAMKAAHELYAAASTSKEIKGI